jgi:hypothetical protein
VLDQIYLDVVIVGANPRLSKTWFAKAWTPDAEPAAPDCFSLDGVRPHADSAAPQSDMCANCPQNAWGSKIGPQGQQLKNCSDKKRLAVVAADDPGGPVYLLEVTGAALKGLGQFQKELNMRGIPLEIVRTKVTFDTDASFPKLKFGFGGYIDEETQAHVDGLFGSDGVKEVTGEVSGSAHQEAVAAPAPKPVLVRPATPPAPPPPPPEPVVPKRGFGAKAAPAPAAAPAAAPVAIAAPKPVAKPKKAAEPAAPAGASLADEIASLIGSMEADDE